MAISERTVQNKRNSAGELTGKPGTVYDAVSYTHLDVYKRQQCNTTF